MNNIQLFRKESADLSNYEIWTACNNFVFEGLSAFYNEAYRNYGFGELLYNEKYTKLIRTLAKDLFTFSYDAIFRSLSRAGTYENLIAIIKAVFGKNSTVDFEEIAPAVINLHITQSASTLFEWVDLPDENFMLTKDGDNIVFLMMIREIFLDEVINLFRQILIPAGVYFDITISYAP
ncbi:MAG: hypothetical protein LBC07_01520 [Elusimicrobiota bacterium]|jgi:hypothetical protein|nr:hypothetical protein [Elusimicrobiota bacterium]